MSGNEIGRTAPTLEPEALRRRLRKKLPGYSPQGGGGIDPWAMRPLSGGADDDLPIPALVLFVMNRVLGYPHVDAGDKVRWAIGCLVAGQPVVFRDRKFGFEILVAQDSTLEWNRIVRPLKGAIRVLEKEYLGPMASQQIELGNVTIENRFGEFQSRYRYFREAADEAFQQAIIQPVEPGTTLADSMSGVMDILNASTRSNRKGFFLSTAMVDAYFSFLEHRLILLRAFTGVPLKPGEFKELLGSNWDGKLENVIKLTTTATGQQLLGQLRRIKEKVRNPFAHGGVENDRGSIFVHLPGFGALPANFSQFKDSVRFKHLPLDADDLARMGAIFDDLDSLLESGSLAGPHRFIAGGADAAFDPEALGQYADAIKEGEETIDAHIDAWGEEWMRHANADY